MKIDITQTHISVDTDNNKILKKVVDTINTNSEIKTLWKINNVNATKRLGWSDHGPTHFQIVAHSALRLARILKNKNIEFSITSDFGLLYDYAEVVIFLASVLHDVGMTIEREGHEQFSLFLVNNLLHESLSFMEITDRTIVISETLHAIISHRSGGRPLTIEAGIVRIADALDMTRGRARIPYKSNSLNIHSISESAIDSVDIRSGSEVPIEIHIDLNNSAGIFHLDELLKEKIKGSGLEKYIIVKARLDRENEKKLVREFILKDL